METNRRRSARISNLEEKQRLEKESETRKKKKKKEVNLKTNGNGSKNRKHKGKTKLKALEELTRSVVQGMQPNETGSPRKSGQKVSSQKMPEKHVLEFVLDLLQRKDRFNLFADPVNPGEVEAYYQIVKKPMDFSTIRTKLNGGMYTNLEQFENDVYLICRNTRNFTPSNTLHNREATHLCEYAMKVFQTLRCDLDTFKLAFALNKRRSESKNPQASNTIQNSSNFLQGSNNDKDSNSSATGRGNSSDHPQIKGKALINADDVTVPKSLDHNNERSEFKECLLRSAKEAGEAAAAAYGWKLQPPSLPVSSKQVQSGMAGDKQVGNMDMRDELIKGKAINCTSHYAPLTRMNTIQGTDQENEPIFSDLMAATFKWNTGNWLSYPICPPNYMEMKNSPESDIMVWPTQVISDHTQSRMQPKMNAMSDLEWSSSLFPSQQEGPLRVLGNCSLILKQKAVPANSLPPLPPHLQTVQVMREVPNNGLPPLHSQLETCQVEDPTWLPPLSQGQSSLPAEMGSLFQVQFPVNQNMGFMNRVGDGHYSSAMPCEFNCAFHTARESEVTVPWIQTPEYRGSSFCMPVEIDIWGRNKPPQQEIEMALSCDMSLVNETGSSGLDNQGLEALLPTGSDNKNPNLSLQL